MNYKAVVHRYGNVDIHEFDTLKELESFKKYTTDYGEGFIEYILDNKNIITEHGFDHVVGIELEESPIGKKYDIEKMEII